jgi:hypothetical protein
VKIEEVQNCMNLAAAKLPTEAEVVSLWLQQMQVQRRLKGAEGEPVEVVYPGRLNDGRGGDFRDAVISYGRATRYGCIEVHSLTSGWQAHGHHRDPDYNRVVLHVALEQDYGGQTRLENGQAIPTVVLNQNRAPGSMVATVAGLPCRDIGHRSASEELEKVLEAAGERRMDLKAARFLAGLKQTCGGQVLYEGLLEALGYSKNQRQFLELARQVPLSQMESILREFKGEEECLVRMQAFLLGKAGLLPSQRHFKINAENYPLELEKSWATCGSRDALSSRDWELFKVRPGNYPVRRIAAFSRLLWRFRQKTWPQWLPDLVRHCHPNRAHLEMKSALQVAAEGYWAAHYDFGRPGPANLSPLLLGGRRAAEIIINVWLPFSAAWSVITADPELEKKVRLVYAGYPQSESNSIQRHMMQQLSLNSRLVNSARRQQGLIHIYKNYCILGKCKDCDLLYNT